MDLLQCCQQRHHADRPQSRLRDFSLEDFDSPAQFQLGQHLRLYSDNV